MESGKDLEGLVTLCHAGTKRQAFKKVKVLGFPHEEDHIPDVRLYKQIERENKVLRCIRNSIFVRYIHSHPHPFIIFLIYIVSNTNSLNSI